MGQLGRVSKSVRATQRRVNRLSTPVFTRRSIVWAAYKISFSLCLLSFSLFSPTNVPLSPSPPSSQKCTHSCCAEHHRSLQSPLLLSVGRVGRDPRQPNPVAHFDVADFRALLRHRKARYNQKNIVAPSNCSFSIFLQRRRRCRLSSSRELLAPRSAVMSRRLAVC